ncbi:hypothetical protein GCM10027615_00390 [Plantactinospora veratri]
MGVLNALRMAGVRVPQQVSVVGIDDHDLAGAFGLTTVAQPAAEQGRRAAGTLLGPLAGQARTGEEPAPVILPTRLVVRDSTGPPRAN